MKQYTTPEQTAKLIELGFEKPKGLADAEPSSGKWVREAYSISELIEMLPKVYDANGLVIEMHSIANVWIVRYPTIILIHNEELIDALYDMVVKLREEE